MARHSKPPATPLASRVARARTEGRTQQALELARQLYKQSPTPEHQELVRQVVLERGSQLLQQGHSRDAAAVFANGLTLGGSPEYRATIVERLAASGDAAHALQALGPDADPRLRQRVHGQLADAALRQGHAGRATLPAELHAGFDAIVQAFAHAEAGRDDDARATLQPIGLTSPFLEWKLLVRGLLAYYAREDARALENWQRLDPNRLPARLAAPLCFRIDAAFRAAQPPATQSALQQQAHRLAGPGPAADLAALRTDLAGEKPLGPAFRHAEKVVPELRRDHPRLVPRLAHCFFWAIVAHGQPEDVDRYRRVFGPLATDLETARLEALALEQREMWPEAHAAWQRVVETLPGAPDWPGEVGRRAQALVWERMGHNAAEQERDAGRQQPWFFRLYEKPPPPKPGAAPCFERSIKLAPDRLDGYLALFHYHREHEQTAKARKVGEQLLQRFPDHAETSEALGDLSLETQEPARARAYFEKALAANPLERRLRGKLARARQNLGLERLLAEDFDGARAEYDAALALNEGPATSLLAQSAVLEIKAGRPEAAAELIARAEQTPDQRLAVRYALVGEATRAKVPPAERKRLSDELTAALAGPPRPAEALALLAAAAHQRQRKLDAFRGQKTLERTFVRFLDRIPFDEFDEDGLIKLCAYLQLLDARRPWERLLKQAGRRFPNTPFFPLSYIDFYMSRRDPGGSIGYIRGYLERARQLVHRLPREQQERYLPLLRRQEEQVGALDPGQLDMFDMMGRMIFDGGPEDDEEENW